MNTNRALPDTVTVMFLLSKSRMPDGFFSFRELDRRRISIILERSLQDLVDRRAPITAIQFRLACRGPAGVSNRTECA